MTYNTFFASLLMLRFSGQFFLRKTKISLFFFLISVLFLTATICRGLTKKKKGHKQDNYAVAITLLPWCACQQPAVQGLPELETASE